MMFLSDDDKKLLLTHARISISERVRAGQSEDGPVHPTDALLQHCGVFVSLYLEGKLRGCIGTFSEDEPLFDNVKSMAVSAALLDSRFAPVRPEELDGMKIEISVLTPRIKIEDIREITLGKHGIYMIQGLNRGTLLPQVAVNQGWSVTDFLGNCAKYKAGIGWDGWKSAELYTYEAIVFSSNC